MSGVLRALGTVFGNRNVRSLQLAGMGSTLGIWAYGVALPVYAFRESGGGAHGARTVGLLFFARFVLAALAGPWLGLLADRLSRQRLMLSADLIRSGIFAGMTVVAVAGGTPYIIYVLAVASTIVGQLFGPSQAALMPSLVNSPEELTSANLVGNTVASVGMFAGPALAGILLVLHGPSAVFALNGALFLWSALFVLQIPHDKKPERVERAPFLPELTAGFRTVLGDPALRVVVGLTTAQEIVEGALEVLLVVFALQVLDSGNAGVGWLNTAMGIGSVLGAALVAVLVARRRLAGGFGLGILLWGAPLAVAAALTILPPALVVFAAMGTGAILVQVNGVTLLQRSAGNEVLGRVFAVLESLMLAAMAVGCVIAPLLVRWLGPRTTLVVVGVFLPALLVPLWPALRRIDARSVVAEEPLALLRAIEMFSQLPQQVLERLALGAAAASAAAGEAVVTIGEAGHLFYVIAEGRAVVELETGPVRELGPGDFFGEIALLRDVPRTATVRAIDPLRLYTIERDSFLAAVTGSAPTLAATESVVSARLGAGALRG